MEKYYNYNLIYLFHLILQLECELQEFFFDPHSDNYEYKQQVPVDFSKPDLFAKTFLLDSLKSKFKQF